MTNDAPNVIHRDRVVRSLQELSKRQTDIRNAARDVAAKVAEERAQQQQQQPGGPQQ